MVPQSKVLFRPQTLDLFWTQASLTTKFLHSLLECTVPTTCNEVSSLLQSLIAWVMIRRQQRPQPGGSGPCLTTESQLLHVHFSNHSNFIFKFRIVPQIGDVWVCTDWSGLGARINSE